MPGGPPYATAVERPGERDLPVRACSTAAPLCVHAATSTPRGDVVAALEDLEGAYARLVVVLGLSAPLADGTLGGGPEFDLYLVDGTPDVPLSHRATAGRDPPDPSGRDRASGYGRLDRSVRGGCARKNLVARSVAAATQWGIDAGEAPSVRDAAAAYLAELVAPCAVVTGELIDEFQAHPERALTEAAGGAGVAFPWFLDAALGTGAPGAVPIALAAIGSQKTPAGSLDWQNEPDLFDALRGTLGAKKPPSAISDLLLEFAIARLFMGDRDDGAHPPLTAWAGPFGRVRFDWSLPFASLPRRLAPREPIDPTGTSYLYVDLTRAPAGSRLAFRADWEAPVPFRWALVRLAADGSEASRVLVTPQERSTSAERVVENLDGLSALVVVGVNVGDIELKWPFDPDERPFEPHGYVVTLALAP
jgi:hypothetical protein